MRSVGLQSNLQILLWKYHKYRVSSESVLVKSHRFLLSNFENASDYFTVSLFENPSLVSAFKDFVNFNLFFLASKFYSGRNCFVSKRQ